jgi:hypothetical protein
MSAATVNMNTYSDADFVKAFMLRVTDDSGAGASYYYDFAGVAMQMMIRKKPEDVEVFVALSTDPGDGIVLSASDSATPAVLDTINVTITRSQLSRMPEGDYAHSLIMTRADGIADDIWRGTLTHAIGPTR